ncbi:MAG: hypothetical protein OEW25_05450, partial [Nitrospira sp.]|nr:hypothetical protein [Nitrospira sp.]
MPRPFVLPLSQCADLELAGGKALGLARLLAAGFPVPPGICITTEAYDQTLRLSGFAQAEEWLKTCALSGQERVSALSDCQARIKQVDNATLSTQWLAGLQALAMPPDQRWAVR